MERHAAVHPPDERGACRGPRGRQRPVRYQPIPPVCSTQQAVDDATEAVNAEEGTTIYQDVDSGANNYVSLSTAPNITISAGVTISDVTITIKHSSNSFVPFVGSIPVTTHATARYS